MFKKFLLKILAVLFGVSHAVMPVAKIPEQATTTPAVATTTKITLVSTVKTEQKPTTSAKKILAPTVNSTETIQTATSTKVIQNPAEATPDFQALNTFARSATVNIFCTANGNELSPVSGTGVIINAGGLILTNAHVAEYFLLKDYRQKNYINCIARTGSPATAKYNLELVYISPTWVEDNKDILKEQEPKGTGENDFAFLRVTSSTDGEKLPETFPFVPLNIRETVSRGEPVLLISYPAGFLGGISITSDLSVTSAITTIKDIFTFKQNTTDLLAVPGTVISQKGSSGGLVIDKYGTLLGIISTSSDGDTTSDRELNAITVAYINRSLQTELDINLEQFLFQDLAEFAKDFQKTEVPKLSKTIIDELNKP